MPDAGGPLNHRELPITPDHKAYAEAIDRLIASWKASAFAAPVLQTWAGGVLQTGSKAHHG